MEIFSILIINAILLLILLLWAAIVNFLILNVSQGLAGFQLLTLELLNYWLRYNPAGILLATFLVIIPVSTLVAVSWIGSELAYLLRDRFTVLDLISICACFSFCMFSYMATSQLSFTSFRFLPKEGEIEHCYRFSWEGLDKALTPTTIVTSFVMLGLFITYYHHK